MKHNIHLFVILLATITWLLPQHLNATLDVATNLRKPFTIETTTTASGGRIEFRHVYETTGSNKNTINLEYRISTDGGDSWGEWEAASISGTTSYKQFYNNSITLSASTSYTIQFRGYNPSGFSKNTSTDYYRIILGSSSTAWNVTMSGNIMSLIVGYDTSNETAAKASLAAATTIPCDNCFFSLFDNYVLTGVGMTGEPLYTMRPPRINAENLIFPATTLTTRCYARLFYSTSSTNSSYKNNTTPNGTSTLISTYNGGLNEGPCFLATSFGTADYVFNNTFNQCSSLNSAHFNFTTCPTNHNFDNWVYGTKDSKTIYAPAVFTSCTYTYSSNTRYILKCPSYSSGDCYWYGDWSDKVDWSYVAAPETYTVTWKSEDGQTTLETDDDQSAGATTAFNGSTPTKTPTAQYTYTFDGWTTAANGSGTFYADGSTPAVSGDVTYYAHFAATTRNYTVTVEKNNTAYGTLTGESNNTVAISSVPYNTSISISGSTLTINGTIVTATPHANDAQYTYTFTGWTKSPNNATVTEDMTITANFTRTTNTYTLTWNFNGGTTTEDYTNGLVEWGTPITAPTPTKDGCTFAGWDITPTATMPAATTTYTAQWTDCTISALTLIDDEGAAYYDVFVNDYNGVEVETVTYSRTFRADTWSTVCLPFYVDENNLSGAGWLGSVYEFKHATGNADAGLYLNFYPAREMEAGKGYLVYSRGADLSGDFEFYDVTIDTSKDTEDDITDLAGYNDGQGTITLVGTLRKGTLTPNATSQMALKDNKVWYPGSGTTTIRAYRGFFKDSSGSSIPPRVHIVVEGEVVTDLEIMENGELRMDNAEVRKYIDNGVLIIERNGIRYDAQGKRIDN